MASRTPDRRAVPTSSWRRRRTGPNRFASPLLALGDDVSAEAAAGAAYCRDDVPQLAPEGSAPGKRGELEAGERRRPRRTRTSPSTSPRSPRQRAAAGPSVSRSTTPCCVSRKGWISELASCASAAGRRTPPPSPLCGSWPAATAAPRTGGPCSSSWTGTPLENPELMRAGYVGLDLSCAGFRVRAWPGQPGPAPNHARRYPRRNSSARSWRLPSITRRPRWPSGLRTAVERGISSCRSRPPERLSEPTGPAGRQQPIAAKHGCGA